MPNTLILYVYTSSMDDYGRLGFFAERTIKDDAGNIIKNPTLDTLRENRVDFIDRRDERFPEMQCEVFVKNNSHFPEVVKKIYKEASGKLCELTVQTRAHNGGINRKRAGVALDFVRIVHK